MRLWLGSTVPRGTLKDVLQNNGYNLDDNFKYSISHDVAAGMKYLHSCGLVHGNLTSSSCLIDSKWTAKISDWQYSNLARLENDRLLGELPELSGVSDEETLARYKFWSAPECLEGKPATQQSDSYSFSIMVVEIFTREDPFEEALAVKPPSEVLKMILGTHLRPAIPEGLAHPLRKAVEKGWGANPVVRPNFLNFVKIIDISRPTTKSVLDCMMETLEEYMVTWKTRSKRRQLN